MRVTLAIDGSTFAAQARDLVASLSWPNDTEVTLVTAYQIPAAMVAGWSSGGRWPEEADVALHGQAAASQTALAQPLIERGLKVTRRIIEGRPADVILEIAEETEADLIVLGSRGLGRIGSMLLGSVSAEVAANARRSVLVTRGAAVTRLLVATDGEATSEAIPRQLARWGVFRNVPAVVVSVSPSNTPVFDLLVALYTFGDQPTGQEAQELRELHAGYARTMAAALSGTGIPAQVRVRTGDAAHEITSAIREEHADLVVAGSHSLRGLDRWLLGSVARNVLTHADASVLIVRDAPAELG